MSATTAIASTLEGFAGLQALIGNGDSPITSRIYPLQMPQKATRPAVVYQIIDGNRVNTLTNNGGSGVERFLIQITAWADTVIAAENVIEQVRLALVADAVNYVPISYDQIFEPDTKLYGVRRDFSQWYR